MHVHVHSLYTIDFITIWATITANLHQPNDKQEQLIYILQMLIRFSQQVLINKAYMPAAYQCSITCQLHVDVVNKSKLHAICL